MLIILFGDSMTTIQYLIKKNGTDIQVQDGDTSHCAGIIQPNQLFFAFFV